MLLIAGGCRDSELLAEIEQAAQVDLRILLRPEFVKDNDIQVYMNACDWVVLPYQKILNSGAALLLTRRPKRMQGRFISKIDKI